MGCSESVEGQIPKDWWEQFTVLKLSKNDVKRLFRTYNKIDCDHSGSVELNELFAFLNIENTQFTERVFRIFDMNHTNKVDFREFTMSLWNYLTLGKATLDIFTFDLYDEDASGILSHEEVVKMLTDLYGAKHLESNPNAKAVFHELNKMNEHLPFTVERFTKFAKTHQGMLFPAFQLQLHLQEKVCGVAFWTHCSNRRIELSKGKFVTMGELMEVHVRADLYDKFVRNGSFYGKRMQSRAQMVMENTGTLQSRNGPQPEEPQHHSTGHAYTFSIGDDKVTPAPARYLNVETHGHIEHGKGAAHHHPAPSIDHHPSQSDRHSGGPGYTHLKEENDQVHSPTKHKPNNRSSAKESHKESNKSSVKDGHHKHKVAAT